MAYGAERLLVHSIRCPFTNSRFLQSASVLAALTGTIGAVGATSNASALYSHYWASRSIRDADLATRWGLERVKEDEIDPPEALFRLAGRDPKLPGNGRYPKLSTATHPVWPPQRLLHPWHLLPLVACAGFIAMPLSVGRLQTAGADDASVWLLVLPILALTPLVALFASERVLERRAQKNAKGTERSLADDS